MEQQSNVALLMLAAGASTRMGQPKQLLPYQGKSLLRRSVEVAIASVCQPIAVVLGANADRMQLELQPFAVQTIVAAHWDAGMNQSLRCGIEFLTTQNPRLEAMVIMVCDQPFVSAALIHQLIAAYEAGEGTIVASAYADVLGVPALFDRTWFEALLTLPPDVGARKLIAQNRHAVCAIAFPEGQIDIDTPEDYQQLQG